MRDLDDLFTALARSRFRSRFHLSPRDRRYLAEKGFPTIVAHADRFIRERLAPADPANDGRQTPLRNHPVFVAQHATATCCRGCLQKWHHIPRGVPLTEKQIAHIQSVLIRWLRAQQTPPDNPTLFPD